MRSIVYCGHCGRQNGWPIPPVRVTNDPCAICGGHESIRQRKRHRLTGEPRTEIVTLKNFEHRASLLPGTPEEAELQKEAR